MPIPVSFTKCPDYQPENVRRSLTEALEPLGGMGSFVKPGMRVLLKPNLIAPKPPESAACTHPEVIRAVAREVKAAGGKVFLGDSPPLHPLETLLAKAGIAPVCAELGITPVPFKTPVTVPGPGGGRYRTLEMAAEARGFDVVINLPKLKSHGQMTLTLAVKNLFGVVVGMDKPTWHLRAGNDRRFADLLLDIYLIFPPALSILDGILGMEGNGPASGTPRTLGLLGASPNPLALDQAVATLLGVDHSSFLVWELARERKLPGAFPEELAWQGPPRDRLAVRDFQLPPTARKITDTVPLPLPLAWFLKRWLSPYPVIIPETCTACYRCRDACPARALTIFEDGGGKVDRQKCIGCFCCQEFCPVGAIRPHQPALGRWFRRFSR